MPGLPVEEILEKLSARVGKPAALIRYEMELPALEHNTLSACRNEIRAVLRSLREQTGKDWKKIRGIGFADPGLVDVAHGISLRAVNVPGWENAKTGEWLSSEYNVSSGVCGIASNSFFRSSAISFLLSVI